MSKCRNVQGALAASLYEALGEEEQRTVDAHLESCAACRAQHQTLQQLTNTISVTPIPFEGDLLPAVREELRRTAPSGWGRRWAGLGAAALVVMAGFAALHYAGNTPDGPEAMAVADLSPTEQILQRVQERLDADDHSGAMAVLEDALAEATGTPNAGPLQLAKANLEYDVFHRYEEAYREYRALREAYGETWTTTDPHIKERFDLLTEARDGGFEALYQMDNARTQGGAALPVLEQVMARYPGRQLAREAMNTMVALVEGSGVEALEAVKSRCSNPMAVAQLDVYLGERYCVENKDSTRGLTLLHGVADGALEVPARMARDVLARLEPGTQ